VVFGTHVFNLTLVRVHADEGRRATLNGPGMFNRRDGESVAEDSF